MRMIMLKDEDAVELLETLELSKHRQQEHSQSTDTINDIHRSFHYHVTAWLQKHGFNASYPR